jgi:hypothetical protein
MPYLGGAGTSPVDAGREAGSIAPGEPSGPCPCAAGLDFGASACCSACLRSASPASASAGHNSGKQASSAGTPFHYAMHGCPPINIHHTQPLGPVCATSTHHFPCELGLGRWAARPTSLGQGPAPRPWPVVIANPNNKRYSKPHINTLAIRATLSTWSSRNEQEQLCTATLTTHCRALTLPRLPAARGPRHSYIFQ